MKLKEEKREIEWKEKKSASDVRRLSDIEEEMKPFETFINDAREHRQQIKNEIGILPALSTFIYSQIRCATI